MVMDTLNQVLCGHGLMILRNVDWSSNVEGMLNQRRCNGDHPLDRHLTSLSLVGEFTIACCRREICIEIGIAKTPCWRYVKPGIGCRVRDLTSSSFIGSIEQVNICNASSRQPPPRKSGNTIIPNEAATRSQFS